MNSKFNRTVLLLLLFMYVFVKNYVIIIFFYYYFNNYTFSFSLLPLPNITLCINTWPSGC